MTKNARMKYNKRRTLHIDETKILLVQYKASHMAVDSEQKHRPDFFA